MCPSVFGDPDFKDLNLRQQLARIIYNLSWGRPAYSEVALPAPVDSNPHAAPWLAAADECLRQMEWARRNCIYTGTDPVPPPITLAPKDWKAWTITP